MDAGGANDDCGTPDSDAGRQPGGEPKSKKSNRPNQSQRKRAAQLKLAAVDAAKGAAAHAAIDAAATAATVAEAQAKRAADKAAVDEAARNKVSTDKGWKEAAATLAEMQGCLRLQNDVDQSHGPLKGVCMFCAVFKYGYKFGVGLGAIGKCGYAHFIDGGVADAAATELKERCGFPAPPRWAHDFIVAGARTGHGGDGLRFGTQRGGRGDRGGGKGGKGGKGGIARNSRGHLGIRRLFFKKTEERKRRYQEEPPGVLEEPPGKTPAALPSPRRPAGPRGFPGGSSWGQEEPQAAIPTHKTTPTATGKQQGKQTRAGEAAGRARKRPLPPSQPPPPPPVAGGNGTAMPRRSRLR